MKIFSSLLLESFQVFNQKLKPILVWLLVYVIIVGISTEISTFLDSKLSIMSSSVSSGVILSRIDFLFIFLESFAFIIFLFLSGSYMGAFFITLMMKPIGTSLIEIAQEAWKKLWQYLLIVMLIWSFIILGLFLFIIPGLIISIYLAFSTFVFIDEGKTNMEALKRSWNLVKGNWWKVLGRWLLLSIVLFFVFVLLGSINNLLGSIFSALSTPFSMIFVYLIYLELKKSKELQPQILIQE